MALSVVTRKAVGLRLGQQLTTGQQITLLYETEWRVAECEHNVSNASCDSKWHYDLNAEVQTASLSVLRFTAFSNVVF